MRVSFMPARLKAMLLALVAVLLPVAAAQGQPSHAQDGSQSAADAREAEARAAWQAAAQAATRGPADVKLLDQATLHLPQGMAFIPKAQADRLWIAMGNSTGPGLAGLVSGLGKNDHWTAVIRFTGEGYIRDDDAKTWNADDILANLREGTAEQNKDRAQRGFPELELLGWTQPPAYDAAQHRLVWSLALRDKGAPDDQRTVNYNTRALGRDGYFSLNLITDADRIAADRAVAATLLAGLDYAPGKRYQDFNASTDRVAEYGLAALIGVVAAKKLGLLALAGAFPEVRQGRRAGAGRSRGPGRAPVPP